MRYLSGSLLCYAAGVSSTQSRAATAIIPTSVTGQTTLTEAATAMKLKWTGNGDGVSVARLLVSESIVASHAPTVGGLRVGEVAHVPVEVAPSRVLYIAEVAHRNLHLQTSGTAMALSLTRYELVTLQLAVIAPHRHHLLDQEKLPQTPPPPPLHLFLAYSTESTQSLTVKTSVEVTSGRR